ncbi:MAG: hypothetical protein Q8L45_02080, partial [Xanthomonadaceae bacterium]|nr:hypothetical protein [Xanthomonadaceae bacterium]
KAKTAAAVLDNRLLIEGWVERSETHQPGHYNALDGFRCALPILRLSLDLGGLRLQRAFRAFRFRTMS